MITAERTYDEGLIKYVIYKLWDEVAPPGASPEDFNPDLDNKVWLEVWYLDELLGVYGIEEYSDISLMGHANILPEHRRKFTKQITLAVAEWMKDNIGNEQYKELVVTIPVNRPNVLKYAYRAGFKDKYKTLSMPLEDFYRGE